MTEEDMIAIIDEYLEQFNAPEALSRAEELQNHLKHVIVAIKADVEKAST